MDVLMNGKKSSDEFSLEFSFLIIAPSANHKAPDTILVKIRFSQD